MTMRDLIPWRRGRDLTVRGGDEHPFFTLHREMNRLFDDFGRGFDLTPFGSDRWLDRVGGNWHWPNIELRETDWEIKVTAELPGLDEKDVNVELSNGVLSISGEKKTESEDKDQRFSERYYGRFERRIPVEDVDEDKVSATFKKGLLTVILPKLAQAQSAAKRISINNK
jgi:HSP20 family protein